jgi:hypothetical protein
MLHIYLNIHIILSLIYPHFPGTLPQTLHPSIDYLLTVLQHSLYSSLSHLSSCISTVRYITANVGYPTTRELCLYAGPKRAYGLKRGGSGVVLATEASQPPSRTSQPWASCAPASDRLHLLVSSPAHSCRGLCLSSSKTMGYSAFRPLPTPPLGYAGYFNLDSTRSPEDMADPYYFARYPATVAPRTPAAYDQRQSTLPGGTLLHQGFYDLLSMIPTPNPSRLISGWTGQRQDILAAGPRYEEIGSTPTRKPGSPTQLVYPTKPISPPTSPTTIPYTPPKKGRRISKDMVSKPTNFV